MRRKDYSNIIGNKNPNYRTGLAPADHSKRSSLYQSWQGMKQRCLNPNRPKYDRYGGRGIKICDEWLSIYGFVEWALNNGWAEGLSIDRIDNDGNYEPSNCRWVSMSFNSKNKRTTKLTDDDAIDIRESYNSGISMSELAKLYNVNSGTIWFIVKNRTHIKDNC